MKAFRFSLRGMLATVALVAFGCLALLNAAAVWASIAFTASVLILLTAAVGIVYREGERRASYVGASFFGWTYMLLSFGPGFSESTKPFLVSTPLLELLYPQVERQIKLHADERGDYIFPDAAEYIELGPGRLAYRFPIRKHFRTVGHSLFALVFAAVGGIVTRLFYFTNLKFVRRNGGAK